MAGVEPDPDDFPWELYNVTKDFSQSNDLAKQNPKKLDELKADFLIEAVKYNVLPIDFSFGDRADPAIRPNYNPLSGGKADIGQQLGTDTGIRPTDDSFLVPWEDRL